MGGMEDMQVLTEELRVTREKLRTDSVHQPAVAFPKPLRGASIATSLEQCIIDVFSSVDTQGNEPEEQHGITVSQIANVLRNHPELPANTDAQGKPLSMEIDDDTKELAAARRARDAIKRTLKAIPEIRLIGSTRNAHYVYDSTWTGQHDEILRKILSELMRNGGNMPPMEIVEVFDEDESTVLEYLDALEEEGVIELKRQNRKRAWVFIRPGIWGFEPGGKGSFNFTLSSRSSNLFDDIAHSLDLIRTAGLKDEPRWPFPDIAIPEDNLSRSLIVEIALWALYHRVSASESGPRLGDVSGMREYEDIVMARVLRSPELQRVIRQVNDDSPTS
jgi:DNA-binding transcriptional ArsR family regulator